jgi:hypothetical protein
VSGFDAECDFYVVRDAVTKYFDVTRSNTPRELDLLPNPELLFVGSVTAPWGVMKMKLSTFLIVLSLAGATLSHAQTTATPVISLATGTYSMPQNTTITDSTSGASILWCYTGTGTCTPATAYTGTIYVDPATTETICANATASGYAKSATVCNYYTNGKLTATPAISLKSGAYVMPQNTTITDSTSGASILWCYTGTGTCTPATTYTGTIYVDPATTETICADATASGYTKSSTVCNSYTNETPTATPVISLTSGTYVMPQNTTITDSTSGASILWCYVGTGTCTPATAYTGTIYVDPATTETICADATASGYTKSATTCNSYTASSGNSINFTYSSSSGQVTMSTSLPNASIFYTLDGSTATEASIEYVDPVPVAPGTVINAVAVQMVDGSGQGVAVQNGQATASDWKTVLASTSAQSSPYVSNYDSPAIKYCATAGCNQGVTGIPTAIDFLTSQPLPSLLGAGTATNFSFTTEGLTGTYGSGTQVLWPYNVSPNGGCDTCTSMIEDFYIWPQHTATVSPANVQNWELDMNSWKLKNADGTTDTYGYLGASFQCSIVDGGWQYNGQNQPGWKNFYLDPHDSPPTQKLNHDCQLPFGTLTSSITSTATSFSVAPNVTGSVTAATVEAGMIVLIDDEEIFCNAASGNTCTSAQRGWAGTTPATHSAGALYSGSVHVQYHVTFKPADTSVCKLSPSNPQPVECVFIDYLYLNNVQYNFHTIYGEQTVSGVAGYSALTVPAYTYTYGIDRVYDQKQLDVAPGVGSPSNPVKVGEFFDQDDVTASFGIQARQSYTVP